MSLLISLVLPLSTHSLAPSRSWPLADPVLYRYRPLPSITAAPSLYHRRPFPLSSPPLPSIIVVPSLYHRRPFPLSSPPHFASSPSDRHRAPLCRRCLPSSGGRFLSPSLPARRIRLPPAGRPSSLMLLLPPASGTARARRPSPVPPAAARRPSPVLARAAPLRWEAGSHPLADSGRADQLPVFRPIKCACAFYHGSSGAAGCTMP